MFRQDAEEKDCLRGHTQKVKSCSAHLLEQDKGGRGGCKAEAHCRASNDEQLHRYSRMQKESSVKVRKESRESWLGTLRCQHKRWMAQHQS
eukprot:1161762-Pelagomonas_calceolata.AAC.2